MMRGIISYRKIEFSAILTVICDYSKDKFVSNVFLPGNNFLAPVLVNGNSENY